MSWIWLGGLVGLLEFHNLDDIISHPEFLLESSLHVSWFRWLLFFFSALLLVKMIFSIIFYQGFFLRSTKILLFLEKYLKSTFVCVKLCLQRPEWHEILLHIYFSEITSINFSTDIAKVTKEPLKNYANYAKVCFLINALSGRTIFNQN